MTAKRTDELDTGQLVQVGVIYRPIKHITRDGDRTYRITLGTAVTHNLTDIPTDAIPCSRLWITTPPSTYGPTQTADEAAL